MALYLLMRDISQYTFPGIVLGCFTTLEKAQKTRREYIDQYQTGERIDPWKEQSYKTVVLEDDVRIIDDLPIIEYQDIGKNIFIVNVYSEFLGQVMREFIALCGTQESAQVRLDAAKAESLEQFAESFKIEKFLLDTPYPDDNLQEGYWWK